MNEYRAMNWVLGGALFVMFIMFIIATHDRDTAMRAIIEADGATITVTCKEPTHGQ